MRVNSFPSFLSSLRAVSSNSSQVVGRSCSLIPASLNNFLLRRL